MTVSRGCFYIVASTGMFSSRTARQYLLTRLHDEKQAVEVHQKLYTNSPWCRNIKKCMPCSKTPSEKISNPSHKCPLWSKTSSIIWLHRTIFSSNLNLAIECNCWSNLGAEGGGLLFNPSKPSEHHSQLRHENRLSPHQTVHQQLR